MAEGVKKSQVASMSIRSVLVGRWNSPGAEPFSSGVH